MKIIKNAYDYDDLIISGEKSLFGTGNATGQVTPDVKKVRYNINLKRVIRRKLVLGIADGTMEADGEVIYKAKDLRVGLFIPPQDDNKEGAG